MADIAAHVVYPKPIEVPHGLLVHVEGVYDSADRLQAWFISLPERGLSYQLHPDEHPAVEPFKGEPVFGMPLVGQVVECRRYGDYTHLTVYPTNPPRRDYFEVAGTWNQLAVPAFWKAIRDRETWKETFVPSGVRLFRLKGSAPDVLPVGRAVVALRSSDVGADKEKADYISSYFWQAARKLQSVDRHRERLVAIKNLRVHLYGVPKSEGRDFMLSETRAEAALTVEAAASSAYAALDTLGHVVNAVYGLGHSRNTVGFFGVLVGRPVDPDGGQTRRSLVTDYPNHALTDFLFGEREQWISDLERWRHHIIHHGCLSAGEVVGGDAIVFCSDRDDAGFPKMTLDGEAVTIVSGWTEKLENLISRTAEILTVELDARKVVATEPETLEVPPPSGMSPLEVVTSFLDLWSRSSQESIEWSHLYGRLSRDWRRSWAYDEFKRYVQANPLSGYRSVNGSFQGTDASGQPYYSTQFLLEVSGRWQLWTLVVVPEAGKGYSLKRTPQSTPQPLERKMALEGFSRKQSGRDTGHRDLVFSGTVSNLSDQALEESSLHVFWHNLAVCSMNLGDLPPNTMLPFQVVAKDAFVPLGTEEAPMSLELYSLRATLDIRIVYKHETPLGRHWSECFAVGSDDTVEPHNSIEP